MANVTFKSNLLPKADSIQELGSAELKWKINGVENPEFLPNVTTEDNNKILQVVNGVWTAVPIPDIDSVPPASGQTF